MQNNSTDIAIIGIAGRYPRSHSPAKLWENIIKNIDLVDSDGIYEKNYVNKFYSLNNIELFDYNFFGYTSHDASITDPQHRILLECAHEALEDAGYETEPENFRIGVFATTSMSTYLLNVIINSKYYEKEGLNYPIIIGNDKDFIATKISHKLNLTGPSCTLQCACSSSLVATHYACQSLLNSECDIALVGAVSISIPQEKGYYYKEGGILSVDGVCRPFDEGANGTVKGNGCSVIVLKKLDNSVRDNDHIYAIIKGSAVNNDGNNKIGYSAPSILGESAVIREALISSKLSAADIDYIETHGTGTKIGDPIEIRALNEVFVDSKKKIPLGSIKANIGHLDVAAGITSIIKSIFMLNEGVVPPIKNFQKTNPLVNEFHHNFYFPTTLVNKKINNISVSSFGLGGTNTHLILSKYTSKKIKRGLSLPYYLIPISLIKEEDLNAYKTNISECLLDKNITFCDFALSVATGKKRRDKTLNIIANGKEDFLLKLKNATIEAVSLISIPHFNLYEYRGLRKCLPFFNVLCVEHLSEKKAKNITIMDYRNVFLQFLNKINVLASEKIKVDNDFDNFIIKNIKNSKHVETDQKHKIFIITASKTTTSNRVHPILKLFEFLAKINGDVPLKFRDLYSGLNWKRVSLPSYPLNKRKCWIESDIINGSSHKPSGTLDKIIKIWAESIGECEIHADTNFFHIGGDSLSAVEIIDHLNEHFGVCLSNAEFMNNLTPSLQEAIISKRINNLQERILFPIRESSKTKKNIFLIHPAGGTTFCYSKMNNFIDKEYNIFCLDLPGEYAYLSSMEKLATFYLEKIKELQQNGPYLLGGYSFGGNLAYEIAVQIENKNQRIDKVVMFDSHPPLAYNTYSGEEINYHEAFPEIIYNYFKSEKNNIPEQALYKGLSINEIIAVMKTSKMIDIRLSNEEIIAFYNKWIFSHNLLKTHKQNKAVSADLIMFIAVEAEDEKILNSLKIKLVGKEEWKKHFKGNFIKEYVKGNHYSIFGNENNVKNLAICFEKFLT